MTLVKYAPMHELFRSHNRLDQLVDSFFGDAWSGVQHSTWTPQVDVEETPDAFKFRADLPGLTKQDITISMENNRLTIQGERRNESSEKSARLHRVERVHGSFSRSFRLPGTVLADKIEASYREGVLEVTVPKADEVKPREIEIRS